MCMAAPSALFPILKTGRIPFCLPVHQVRIQVKQDLGELPIVGTHGRPSAGCRRSAGCAEHSPRRWRQEVAGGDSAAALQSDLHLPGTPIYRKPRVVTPCTFSMPRCHHWRTLRTARLCTSGPKWKCLYRCSRPSHRRDGCVPSPQTCVPSPQTFPPRRSSNVLPEPAPLAAAGDATSTAVVVFAAMAAAATRVGGRHHRNRAHGPDFVPDHMAGAPT